MTIIYGLEGGWFDDERTRNLTKMVIFLSIATATIYIVDAAVEIADPFTQDRYKEEYYNGTWSEPVYIAGSAAFYTSVVVGLLCVLLIPLCGCVGAKMQDLNLIRTFCVVSGVCTCCTFCNIWTLLFWASWGNTAIDTCEGIQENGYTPAYCYAQVAFSIMLFVLYALNTAFSWQLIRACEIIVIQTTRPQYTTYAANTQPTSSLSGVNLPVATPVTKEPYTTTTATSGMMEQNPYALEKS